MAPTIYDIVGFEYPATHNDTPLEKMAGVSMLSFLQGKSNHIRTDYIGWELHGAKAIRKGDWKLLWNKKLEKWELYNLKNDIGETLDMSAQNSEVFEELKSYWNKYQQTNNVLPLKRPEF